MKTVCAKNQCTGCMACMDVCRFGAISIKDDLQSYNAVIDETKCINCNTCHKVCQNNIDVSFVSPTLWKQGWAKEKEVRSKSSSGGLATALIKAFLTNGGLVYSCLFKSGELIFEKISEANLNDCKGSKYVKSNPQGIYRLIKEDLNEGEKVLFIGLPCQVSALKIFVGENLLKNLYTVDLICHGTPSPKLLEKLLAEENLDIAEAQEIRFRQGKAYSIAINGKSLNTVMDAYSIAFLECLSLTENCYNCKYARFERVSDITLGDSWGSDLPIEEQRKGVSLILCQTEKGSALLELCDLELYEVDIEKAKTSNHQLVSPSNMPKNREKFFRLLIKETTFNKATFRCLPKKVLKQKIKAIMIKLGIKKV